VLLLCNVSLATGDFPGRIGADAFVPSLAIGIIVTITLATTKGIHGAGPFAVVAPVDQELVGRRDLGDVDAIVGILTVWSAGTAIDRIVECVAVPLETNQIAGAVVTGVAISFAQAERVRVTIVVLFVVIVVGFITALAFALAVAVAYVLELIAGGLYGSFRRRLGGRTDWSLCGSLGGRLYWSSRRWLYRSSRRWLRHWFIAVIDTPIRSPGAPWYYIDVVIVAIETLQTSGAVL
jgi:hypothetical protein